MQDTDSRDGNSGLERLTVELTAEQSDLLVRCLGRRLVRLELSAADLSFLAGGYQSGGGEDGSAGG